MAKNTNKIIAGVLAVVGIYYVVKYYKGKKTESIATPEPIKETPAPTPTSSGVFPLKKGSKGAKVKEVQAILIKIDKSLLPKFGADGDFGSETEGAVVKVLGKKTVDSQADIDRLNVIYNKKTFPYVTRNENTTTGFPVYKPF